MLKSLISWVMKGGWEAEEDSPTTDFLRAIVVRLAKGIFAEMKLWEQKKSDSFERIRKLGFEKE